MEPLKKPGTMAATSDRTYRIGGPIASDPTDRTSRPAGSFRREGLAGNRGHSAAALNEGKSRPSSLDRRAHAVVKDERINGIAC
jgi:hypothetical protein